MNENKNRKYNYIIILYGLFLIILFLGFRHFYGSDIDWLSQHSVIPEYFRNLFYETKKLLPNFAFNLGAGQNIYNFSYYGLLSPIILLSYIFPFIKMIYFIQLASLVLFISFGLLMFKFLKNNFNDLKLAFICSIFSMTISTVNFNFHHHIMFVWYLPFLVIALLGIDKYLKDNKSWLLILGTFLLIMTNYYFSISSLFVIYIYGVYKILKEEKNIKDTLLKCFLLGIRLIIPIMMAMVILLPTLGALSSISRGSGDDKDLIELIIPNLKEVFYKYTSLGLIGVFYISIVANTFSKKNSVSEKFLNITILIFISIPLFMYYLNGRLYIRGKVLIPFIPLIILCYGMFFKKLFKNEINFKKVKLFFVYFMIITSIFYYSNILYCLLIFLSFIIITCILKMRNKRLFIIYTFLVLFITSFICNKFENYVLVDEYKNMKISDVENLFKNINDKGFYRSYNNIIPKNDPNKVYDMNYYSPSLYSSTYNYKYWKFYNFNFGNNISYRNKFITTGTNNELFYTFMGVKYITSYKDVGLYYKQIDEKNNIKLFYNKDAYPICYVSNKIGNLNNYKNLEFPYNIEYLMNKTIVKNNIENNSLKTNIEEYKINNKDSYKFKLKKDYYKKIYLDKKLKGKILYIKFDMKKNQSCKDGEDTFININGISNRLTCKGWLYHNQNKHFNYVIPLDMDKPYLDIEIFKGSYKIENIKVYYSNIIKDKKEELKNLTVDKKDEVIEGNIYLDEDKYLVTTIPFDNGFKIFVNDKEVKKEVVNLAFLGAKLNKGYNKIRIEYEAPLFKLGKLISLVGFLIYFVLLIYEIFLRKNKNL